MKTTAFPPRIDPPPVSPNRLSSCPPLHLLDCVMNLRVSVGDGLNDAEFTQLIRHHFPEDERGFQIFCYSDGCVSFGVPRQNLEDWYPKDRWISPEKEDRARAIAEKYSLTLCEPPDRLGYIVPPPRAHHHLELITRWETVAVLHPLYLKMRLLSSHSANRILWTPKTPLPPPSELMNDLASLYLPA